MPSVAHLCPPAFPGVPGFEASQWYGLVAPAGVAPEIVARLNEQIAKAMSDKAMIEALDRDGAEPWIMKPAEFRAHIEQETLRWADIVKKAKIAIQ